VLCLVQFDLQICLALKRLNKYQHLPTLTIKKLPHLFTVLQIYKKILIFQEVYDLKDYFLPKISLNISTSF